ncbi:hypothetical protein BGZ63DRAFT_372057 [Mariannaea sp. PMI_226]|nr:hypothetical protein BGZ63DRAFT_372057 [Mariannaea sp. PMI_226]
MGSQLHPPQAPWDSAPPQEQLFVLITGANSGIGLAIGERLIDEFLATRSLTSHLILLPTTRSKSKSLQTISALRTYAQSAAQTSSALKSRVGPSYKWEDTVKRIHVLSLQLDLCDLRGVYDFARRLVNEPVSNPEGLSDEYLQNVQIPRLDSVVFNAAYGGWSGVNWPLAIWNVLTKNLVENMTWPEFKNALPTCILNEQPKYQYPAKPRLGEVFSACVFGHYVLAHQLLPLLSRRSENESLGRIVWSSSIEALREGFDISDIQCFDNSTPYESSKRLTDLISLTSDLPSVKAYSAPFFTPDDPKQAREKPIAPKMYLTHPGVVASTLFPLPWFLMWAYSLALVIARWLGSPWHGCTGYIGAKSAAWVALQEQSELDNLDAEHIKWGSSCNHKLEVGVKKTEVPGWGWEGRVEDAKADTTLGFLAKSVGRKSSSLDTTEEDLVEFEALGAQCWKKMEELRREWEKILGIKAA